MLKLGGERASGTTASGSNGKDGNKGTASANALAFTDRLRRTMYYEIQLQKQIYTVHHQIGAVRRLGGTAAARRVGRA